MGREKKIVKIDELLGELFASRDWQQNLERNRIFEFWNEAVGLDIAAQAQPKLIRGKVLWVNVTDSIWMQQLHLLKEHLRQVVNKRIVGEEGISDIRFNLVTTLIPVLAEKKSAARPVKPPPDPAKLADFDRIIAAIADPGARNSFRNLWLAQQGWE
jgi:predicted nucleic acid-binding Zn ribbon protein